MGFGITELIVILLIVLVLFGAKRLRNVGGDLGSAVKGFRSAMKDDDVKPKIEKNEGETIEGEVTKEKDKV